MLIQLIANFLTASKAGTQGQATSRLPWTPAFRGGDEADAILDPYTPRQITLSSAWRFSTVTARMARSRAAGRAAGSSTRSP